jgi:DNA-binding GntR family transcriptional regulator
MMLTMSSYKYEMVADTLRARIRSGFYADGKLPSTRSLREEFQVSYGSVRTAVLILKTEGLLVGRQGEGIFVK